MDANDILKSIISAVAKEAAVLVHAEIAKDLQALRDEMRTFKIDYEKLAGEINYEKLAEQVDPSEVADNVNVDASDVASNLDVAEIASNLDVAEIAENVDIYEYLDRHLDAGTVEKIVTEIFRKAFR